MDHKRMRIGVLGCGSVSSQYLPNLSQATSLELVSVADVDRARAQETARTWGVSAVTPSELLADPTIELVVNLTPIAAHVETNRQILAAGKHIYSEKSLAPTYDEAKELLDQAEAAGVTLSVAPDTLLGSGFSEARASFESGAIGRPLFASVVLLRASRAEAMWYTDGLLPILDMAPYSISALITLLGDVVEVEATTRLWPTGTVPEELPAGAQLGAHAILHFANGAHASVTLAWAAEPRAGEYTQLALYGARGILHVPNTNNFGDPAYVTTFSEARLDDFDRTEIPGSRRRADTQRANLRGLGAAEAATAIRAGRAPRCSPTLAVHAVEVIRAIETAGTTGRRVRVESSATIEPCLTAQERDQLMSSPAPSGAADTDHQRKR